jgi:oligopeptide transport system ATP-binding protein
LFQPRGLKREGLKRVNETILEVKNLKKYFPVKEGLFMREVGQVKAVDGIDFKLKKGETLGLVGESGCGKSTLGRTIIRLYEPTSGEILFQNKDFCALKKSDLRISRKNIQMIFQDPFASLDPRMTISQILTQPYEVHGLFTPAERIEKVKELLEVVGLKASHLNRYPHEFSGGQRQRISIARAIALEPELIIADEPVSALDVSIQAQILNLLKDLQKKLNFSIIFISHDLKVIEHFCDRVAVMYLGRIVETSDWKELFANPKHPYTQALLSAIPQVGEGKKLMQKSLTGEVPSPLNPPTGCHFHPRCNKKFEPCENKVPTLKTVTDSHGSNTSGCQVSCWLFDKSFDKPK